jgi:acyl-CoA hydrolase
MASVTSMPARVASLAFDFRPILQPGDSVAWPQGTGEPLGLTRRLVAQRHDLPGIKLFLGMTASPTIGPDCAERFGLTGLNGAGSNRRLTAASVLDVIPAHVSAVPGLLRSRTIVVDVALIRVRPSPKPGHVTVGVVADYTRALVDAARCVIAEIDEHMPETAEDALLPIGTIDHFVTGDGDEILMPDPEATALDIAVAAQVAAFIPDRATIQLGVGSLPVAVARALLDHRNLGVHSGVVSDILVDLVERGVVTNAYKGLDPGVSITGGLFGTRRLFDYADGNRAIALRSADYTHHIGVMAQLRALYSVNSAVEIDLTGQVNSELAGKRYLGAVGGQVDFVRGAQASTGGRSIIALPSTTPDGKQSRIVASLDDRPVTTARSDVDVIITEFGVAELRGISLAERAKRLTAIAHPDFRDDLGAKHLGKGS